MKIISVRKFGDNIANSMYVQVNSDAEMTVYNMLATKNIITYFNVLEAPIENPENYTDAYEERIDG